MDIIFGTLDFILEVPSMTVVSNAMTELAIDYFILGKLAVFQSKYSYRYL